MSKLNDLPEGVTSAMYLRDGWPHAIVCKVTMVGGGVGIGLFRTMMKVSPETADRAAMLDAINNASQDAPDYSELHEHAKRMKDAADMRAAAQKAGTQEEPETDEDLQAALGQKAHE